MSCAVETRLFVNPVWEMCLNYWTLWVAQWCDDRVSDLPCTYHSQCDRLWCKNTWESFLCPVASVTKWYNLVVAKGHGCFVAGIGTVGLVESTVGLLLGLSVKLLAGWLSQHWDQLQLKYLYRVWTTVTYWKLSFALHCNHLNQGAVIKFVWVRMGLVSLVQRNHNFLLILDGRLSTDW